jgi:hypothetical protein
MCAVEQCIDGLMDEHDFQPIDVGSRAKYLRFDPAVLLVGQGNGFAYSRHGVSPRQAMISHTIGASCVGVWAYLFALLTLLCLVILKSYQHLLHRPARKLSGAQKRTRTSTPCSAST